MDFFVDIESSTGTKYGDGPITSASQWQYTARMDKAGDFSFTMSASDAQAAQVLRKRVVRAWARVGGVWTEVGAGIIDNIVRTPQANGTVLLQVSGADLLRELTYRSVHTLQLMSGGGAITHAQAVTAIGAYAPSGWTFTPATAPANDDIYGQFSGETVLTALIALADKTETHLYRSTGRSVVFAEAFTASGVRAIQAGPGDLAAETCAITGLSETVDSHDLVTRIYPRGAGNAAVQLDLAATTRSAPSGYTLSKTSGYIERASATTAYGLIEAYAEWRDIAPVENTTADIRAASNMLFDEALRELTRRSETTETPYYALSLAGCSALLRPMQTLHVSYRDVAAGMEIETDLNILEATWAVGVDGVQTTAVTVTTTDMWPQTDTAAIVDSVTQGRIYQALPQMNANEYVTSFAKNLDASNTATFRFRFSNAVTALRWAFFEFQVLPFESTVRSITGTVSSSSASGDHTHTVTIAAHTHSVTVPAHDHTVTIAAHTHSVTVPAHDHTVTIAAHTHDVTIAAHTHDVLVYGVADPTDNGLARLVYAEPDNDRFVAAFGAGSNLGATSDSGGSSTPTSSSGGGSTPTTSSGGSSTPTTSSGGSSTPTSSSGGSSTPTTSSGGSSTPTTAAGGNHTHTVTPEITSEYGIFRETSGRTYTLTQLQYRVNSGAWGVLSEAEDLGDGWYRLDISDAIRDSDTLRPTANSNTVEIGTMGNELHITLIDGDGDGVTVTVDAAHGLIAGETITISDTTDGTYDGVYTVDSVSEVDDAVFYLADNTVGNDTTGHVTYSRTATIDAQLSIHTIIQPIYV